MRQNNDIETALYDRLVEDKYSASAHTIPASLGDSLPHIHVTRTGGYTENMVIEVHNVDFDVYAAHEADAMEAAAELCDWVRELTGTKVGTYCYESEVITLPYGNPDPRHLTLARATFKALIQTRTKGALNHA